MTVDAMRAALRKKYGGAVKWTDKVKRMSDEQVIAVYFSMLQRKQSK